MSICYGLIIHRIMASAMTSSSRADRDRRRITYMCIVLVTVFIWNWAWFHAVHIAKIDGINSSVRLKFNSSFLSIWKLLRKLCSSISKI